jgi:hypothetical protein
MGASTTRRQDRRATHVGRIRLALLGACAALICLASVGFPTNAGAVTYPTSGYTIWTIAGTVGVGCLESPCGDGGAATSARLASPQGVAVDAAGDVVIADTDNFVVRFIPVVSGTYFGQAMVADHIYTIAGQEDTGCGSSPCGDGGLATSARLYYPNDVAVDAAGDVVIADTSDDTVRFVPVSSGTYYGQTMVADHIYAVAGTEGQECGSSPCGDTNLATSAELAGPTGVAVDAAGDIAIADSVDDAIRYVPVTSIPHFGQSMTAGHIYTIAGTDRIECGSSGACGNTGAATAATLKGPTGVAFDGAGDVAIVDNGDEVIRFVPVVNGTYYGQGMTANDIYTISGQLRSPCETTTCGDGGLASSASVILPNGIAIDSSGDIFIGDSGDSAVREINAATDDIATIGGVLQKYCISIFSCGDGGAATAAEIEYPDGIALDGPGNILVADGNDDAIRWLTGPQAGATGPGGLPGSAGAQGAPGAAGAQGAPGAAGSQGAPGAAGSQGAPGAAGSQGAPGAAGSQGAAGTAGGLGPQGPVGPQGAPGANGQIELVKCVAVKVKKKTVQKCTSSLVSAPVSFTTSSAAFKAKLSRHGRIVATGTAVRLAGRVEFLSSSSAQLRKGSYTLTVTSESDGYTLTTREKIRIG